MADLQILHRVLKRVVVVVPPRCRLHLEDIVRERPQHRDVLLKVALWWLVVRGGW